jgi:hypothetical protein
LNKVLQSQPEGSNSIAAELHLKGKHGDGGAVDTSSRNGGGIQRSSVDSMWDIVEQVGGKPYYWNRVTNETTYEPPTGIALSTPPPPPPPPKYQLPGLLPPQPHSEIVEDTPEDDQIEATVSGFDVGYDESNNATDEEAAAASSWTLVQEADQAAYYWNTVTNETLFELPEGIPFTIYEGLTNTEEEPSQATDTIATAEGDPDLITSNSASEAPLWQEITSPSGEVMYMNLSNGTSQVEKPVGTTIIVCEEDGVDGPVHWQECLYCDNEQDGEGDGGYYYYYQNISTGENRSDRPVGLVMIAEIVE